MICPRFKYWLGYILSEEDKTTNRSIQYWFKVLDLDDNGILTYTTHANESHHLHERTCLLVASNWNTSTRNRSKEWTF